MNLRKQIYQKLLAIMVKWNLHVQRQFIFEYQTLVKKSAKGYYLPRSFNWTLAPTIEKKGAGFPPPQYGSYFPKTFFQQ